MPDKRSPSSVTGKTGRKLDVVYPDYLPVIDAHMHIQSNNCCPLPLQWGILAKKLGWFDGRPQDMNRKTLNDMAASTFAGFATGRFGKIGRLSTDLVGRLYMNELADEDMKSELIWNVYAAEEYRRQLKKNDTETIRVTAGNRMGLSELNAASLESYEEEFLNETRYYFHDCELLRMCIALPMDLTFAHYWGQYGLPACFEMESRMWFIEDFLAITVDREGGTSDDIRTVRVDKSVVAPGSVRNPEMETRYLRGAQTRRHVIHLHCKTVEGDPFHPKTGSFYSRQFDLFNKPEVRMSADDPAVIRFENSPVARHLSGKEYVHFVSALPDETSSRFEDYPLQREYTIATAIRHPLCVFPFIHFDPRRHLGGDDATAQRLAERLAQEHAFFTHKHDPKSTITMGQRANYHGAMTAKPAHSLNVVGSLKDLIKAHGRSVDGALSEFVQNGNGGLFWGVKMYPRLGYAPDDFSRYPGLQKLYAKCAEKSIPITAHCGPGGMSLADYYLFERYAGSRVTVKGIYDLEHAERFFDGTVWGAEGFDTPARWGKVLSDSRFSKLKLCLAHFGGSDTWNEVGGLEKAHKKIATPPKAGKPGDYKGAVEKYREWIDGIVQLVVKYDNVYTDISYFVNDDPSWLLKAGYDLENTADDLGFLINKNKTHLKDRICMGSDWYMIELDKDKGVGEYHRRMFRMLRRVSGKVGFDAWHQFAVINPLRYLGLIEEKKGGSGPYEVAVEKLENFLSAMKIWAERKEFKEGSGLDINFSDMRKSGIQRIKILRDLSLLDGKHIREDERLLILNK